MSKKSRRRQEQRDTFSPSLTKLSAHPLTTVKVKSGRPLFSFEAVEDRRTHHPLGKARPARTVNGVTSKKLNIKKSAGHKLPAVLAFAAPKKVLICVRRGVRKSVLHALGKTGKGARHSKTRRRSAYSGVSC